MKNEEKKKKIRKSYSRSRAFALSAVALAPANCLGAFSLRGGRDVLNKTCPRSSALRDTANPSCQLDGRSRGFTACSFGPSRSPIPLLSSARSRFSTSLPPAVLPSLPVNSFSIVSSRLLSRLPNSGRFPRAARNLGTFLVALLLFLQTLPFLSPLPRGGSLPLVARVHPFPPAHIARFSGSGLPELSNYNSPGTGK